VCESRRDGRSVPLSEWEVRTNLGPTDPTKFVAPKVGEPPWVSWRLHTLERKMEPWNPSTHHRKWSEDSSSCRSSTLRRVACGIE
jgi:hypothetical protein